MERIQVLKSCYRALKAEPASGEKDVDEFILNFFVENKPPYKDVIIHDLAGQLGLSPDELEERIYNILGSLTSGGLSEGKRPEQATDEAIAQGMKVEEEHTDVPFLQRKIAYDHLAEDPEYYTKLAKMEAGGYD